MKFLVGCNIYIQRSDSDCGPIVGTLPTPHTILAVGSDQELFHWVSKLWVTQIVISSLILFLFEWTRDLLDDVHCWTYNDVYSESTYYSDLVVMCVIIVPISWLEVLSYASQIW